jgi:hypothetical protein
MTSCHGKSLNRRNALLTTAVVLGIVTLGRLDMGGVHGQHNERLLRGRIGQGVGGGVYNLGTFVFDIATLITGNHASTSNDDGGIRPGTAA